MKKKHHRPLKHKHRPRNAATNLAPALSRARARTLSRASAPHWKTILAAVAGGAGSAAIGGLVVNQQILSSEAVGIGLMLGGGATAYFSEGLPRIVGTSVAASGAGQFALAMMNKHAVKAHDDANKNPRTTAPQLAPPPVVVAAPRQSSRGVVLDMFRDASSDLDTLDAEWRYGIRDDEYANAGGGEPFMIDLDEAA